MENPTYNVVITYYPLSYSSQSLVNIYGVTYSMPSYENGGYFIAVMPEVFLSATGSTYQDSLDNLLLSATSSDSPYSHVKPLNRMRTMGF